jgi:NAD-dependent dihydropyrimidine dehydrogenase PreA subunit
MCGKCSEACKYDAIIGETKKTYLSGYLPFEIRQKRCTKCGECVKVCPVGAIEVITTEIEEEAVSSK